MLSTERTILDYYVLDVFTTRRYKGNPLSVVFTKGDLALNNYQDIAREFGYSETSFVYYSHEQKALDIRSFTPTGVEVGTGAGHNLLGAVCAALLKGMQIFKEQDSENRFVIMSNYPIYLNTAFNSITNTTVVQMQQKPANLQQQIPAHILAQALGLISNDIQINDLVPTVVQTEVAHAMVPVKSQQLLNSIVTDNNLLIAISKQYECEGFYCFTMAEENQDYMAEARFFNPIIGIDEDAATGTAAGPLTGFLAINNYIEWNKPYKILQGVKLNQPSLIDVMAGSNGILVGGSSVITMEGKIYI
jgi:PhzF family phenazine biosynthesis protein